MTGSSVALDTNQAIAFLNGTGNVGKWILSYPRVLLPMPVVGELLYGAINSNRRLVNRSRVERLIAGSTLMPVGLATAELYASIRLALRELGRPIPGNDVWIAATCVEHRVPLATADAHFDHVPGLSVVRP